MGKYTNKSKVTGEVTVMELFSQSSNIRTRTSKKVPLQRLSRAKNSGPNSCFNAKVSSVYGFETGEDEDFGFEAEVDEINENEVSRRSTPCSKNASPSARRSTDTTTAQEMDEFFALAEQQQQKQFLEKYNYDIVNDKPVDGRYEWVKLVL